MSEAESRRLLADFENLGANMQQNMEKEKLKQKEELKRKMEEKKVRKLQEQQKKQQLEMEAQITAEKLQKQKVDDIESWRHLEIGEHLDAKQSSPSKQGADDKRQSVKSVSLSETDKHSLESEEAKIAAELALKEQELKTKQALEREHLEQEAAEKEKFEMLKIETQLEAVKKAELERMQLEAKKKAQEENDTKEAARILADAATAADQLQSKFDEDRKQQQDKMRAKLAAKKGQRQAQLTKETEEEKQKILDNSSHDSRDAKRAVFRKAELMSTKEWMDQQALACIEVTFAILKDKVEEIVESRQQEETLNLSAQQMRKQAVLMSTTIKSKMAEESEKLLHSAFPEELPVLQEASEKRLGY